MRDQRATVKRRTRLWKGRSLTSSVTIRRHPQILRHRNIRMKIKSSIIQSVDIDKSVDLLNCNGSLNTNIVKRKVVFNRALIEVIGEITSFLKMYVRNITVSAHFTINFADLI